jgi:hypothetical protein
MHVRQDDAVRNPAAWSRAALMVAYLGLMAAMAGVAWETTKIDLSGVAKVFTALAAGLVGAVINPATSNASNTSKQSPKGPAQPQSPAIDGVFAAHAVIGCAALLVAAAALVIDGGRHVNASDAFVAMAPTAVAPATGSAASAAAPAVSAPAGASAATATAATASSVTAQSSTPNASA